MPEITNEDAIPEVPQKDKSARTVDIFDLVQSIQDQMMRASQDFPTWMQPVAIGQVPQRRQLSEEWGPHPVVPHHSPLDGYFPDYP